MRPSAWWFGLAGLIAIVGIAAAIVIIVAGVFRFEERVDDLERADLPADLSVAIDEPGGYSIYHEFEGSFAVVEPDVTVTDPSGDLVTLDRYDTEVTYTTGRYSGVGLFTFRADQIGVYEVSADGGDPGSGIAVGRGLGGGIVAAALGSVAVGFLGVVAGGIMAIVVGVKRGRNRRAMAPPPAFAGWGGPLPPAGPAGHSPPAGWPAPPPPTGWPPPQPPGWPAAPQPGWPSPPPQPAGSPPSTTGWPAPPSDQPSPPPSGQPAPPSDAPSPPPSGQPAPPSDGPAPPPSDQPGRPPSDQGSPPP